MIREVSHVCKDNFSYFSTKTLCVTPHLDGSNDGSQNML